MLRVFLDNDIPKRLDLSSKYFEQFNKRNLSIREQAGLYEFENIEHGIICAICINPKEYFDLYGIFNETNKKHKSVRKRTTGMDFASCVLLIDDDKRYVFPDGICFLLYGHRDLRPLTEFKNNLKLSLQNLIEKHENDILKYEQNILKENERMNIINSVITQQPTFYKKRTVKRTQFQLDYTTRDFY